MLQLNETTLFYFNLRTTADATTHDKEKASGLVKDWAAKVSRSAKPTLPSLTAKLKTTSSRASDVSESTTTKASTATGNTSIKSGSIGANKTHTKSYEIDVALASDVSVLELLEDADDEEEHEAALSSPVKSKKRLTSAVWFLFIFVHGELRPNVSMSCRELSRSKTTRIPQNQM